MSESGTTPSEDRRADNQPADEQPANEALPSSLFDRWWWRSALWIVAGVVVAYMQVDVIKDGTALWLNWAMVGLAVLVVVIGAVRLARDYQATQRD